MKVLSEWWEQNQIKVYTIIGTIVFAMLIFFVLSIRNCTKPVDTVTLIEEAKKEAQKPLLEIIAKKEAEVKDYKSRLVVSENKYKILVQKYADLQKEKEDVKPAQNDAEMVARFIAHGFAPMAICQCGPGTICFDTGYGK